MSTPKAGLEFMTPRSRVECFTDWASQIPLRSIFSTRFPYLPTNPSRKTIVVNVHNWQSPTRRKTSFQCIHVLHYHGLLSTSRYYSHVPISAHLPNSSPSTTLTQLFHCLLFSIGSVLSTSTVITWGKNHHYKSKNLPSFKPWKWIILLLHSFLRPNFYGSHYTQMTIITTSLLIHIMRYKPLNFIYVYTDLGVLCRGMS